MINMIRKAIIGLSAVALFLSCNHGTNVNEQKTADSQTGAASEVMIVSHLLEKADGIIDREVTVKGMVTHTCKHSGKRCFIIDSLENKTIRIEATGTIESFSNELLGTEITVAGILRERRLDNVYFDEWETKTLAEKEKAEDGGDHCNEELTQIGEMREWMKTHNKDYYPVYYVDGQSYQEGKQ